MDRTLLEDREPLGLYGAWLGVYADILFMPAAHVPFGVATALVRARLNFLGDNEFANVYSEVIMTVGEVISNFKVKQAQAKAEAAQRQQTITRRLQNVRDAVLTFPNYGITLQLCEQASMKDWLQALGSDFTGEAVFLRPVDASETAVYAILIWHDQYRVVCWQAQTKGWGWFKHTVRKRLMLKTYSKLEEVIEWFASVYLDP